jgi:RHS repeat-associated protein
MRTASGDYFYLFDALGSIVGVVDESDHLANTYLYDPYGVTEHQTGTQYNPWQFAGGYFDASTLYYKYGTRYYDRFGRWTQKDPVPSANPYLYANDDPVNETDPNGRISGACVVLTLLNVGEIALAAAGIYGAIFTSGLTLGSLTAYLATVPFLAAALPEVVAILFPLLLAGAIILGAYGIVSAITTIKASCSS